MKESDLIAPCGMNCSLCVAYIFGKNDLNKKGFHKKYCPGCIPRGLNCTFTLGNNCELIGRVKIRFCYECNNFPCEYLKRLDNRYRTKYNMCMIDNLNYIKDNGIDKFIEKDTNKWECNSCGDLKCCHNGLCLACNIDELKKR